MIRGSIRYRDFRSLSGKVSSICHNRPHSTSVSDNIHDVYQQQRNNEVIKLLQRDSADGSHAEDDMDTVTLIKKSYVKQSALPKYVPLTKYNDPPHSIPRLAHKLSRTLFSPGVHYTCDPRTHHNNFDKSLLNIPHIDELKMDHISSFTPSSRDTKLLDIAREMNGSKDKKNRDKNSNVKYFSSTSSMTGILMKFHRYLSKNRPINTSCFSNFYPETAQFTSTSELPTSIVVTPKDAAGTIFSLDTDRSTDSEITLSVLGSALELMLTKDPKHFEKYLKSAEEKPEEDVSAYHYAKIGKFVVRSQLDAIDSRLPGTGTFDIKTRAVCAIRFDITHTDNFPTNYEINRTYGLYESFERELFDAARIVMFKYSLQARLGNMDGIFMAFHNIKKFLGFQYLPLSEIDNYFFGEFVNEHDKYGKQQLFSKKYENSDTGELNNSNQNVLRNIVNDFGNHHQTKREALSTFAANYELRISMNLLQNLLDKIVIDTKGKPFRMLIKKVRSDSLIPKETSKEQDSSKEVSINKDNKETTAKTANVSGVENDAEKDKNNPTYSLVVVVNTLEKEELKELQMLSAERIKQSTALLKKVQNEDTQQAGDMKPSERIKFFADCASEFKNKYFKVNRAILKNSVNDGFFAYELKADYFFQGKKSEDKFPMPSVDILDKDKSYTWDFGYEINKINKLEDKKYLYSKFVRNIGMNTYRQSDIDNDVNVYTDDGEVLLDDKATPLQNVIRAYSAKALKRREFFNSNK